MATTHPKAQAAGAVEYFAGKLAYETTPGELMTALDQVFVVDIRDRAAYDAGHIPTARSIPLEELVAVYAELPRDRTIVTYCGDFACGLSLRAALELAQKGFRVKRLLGGLVEWTRKGYPVEMTPPPPEPEC